MEKAKKKRVAILGFAREGESLLRTLRNISEYRGADITVLDKNSDLKVPQGVTSQFGKDYLKGLKNFDVIFRSPGIPYTLPQLYRARCDGVTVTSATQLFFSSALSYKHKLIGVTGTKGKGTTCTLITHILKTAGKKVVLAGNIGKPMLDVLTELPNVDYCVLELSSFQLQDLPFAPHIAVVVDVFPDHLDSHKSLREYYGSKANIGRFQKASDKIFFFKNNPLSVQIAKKSSAEKFPVTPVSEGIRKNYDIASAVTRELGVSEGVIAKSLKTFVGLEHRLEFVGEKHDVRFYNDSAATNPIATAAAIETFTDLPLILIAGGKDKGLDYAPLAKAIKASKNLTKIVLFGENRRKIAKTLKGKVEEVQMLEEAFYRACESIKRPGIILFSPASASFDQFKNYAERGEAFKKLVHDVK